MALGAHCPTETLEDPLTPRVIRMDTTTFLGDKPINRMGFGMGVGLDWQFSETWSFRAEYYTEDFSNAVFNDYCYVCDTWDSNLSQDTMRVSAAMKF